MKKYLVATSVTDLRREPHLGKSSDQETQLLFNEQFMGFSANNGWVYGTAIEQKKLLPNGEWQGYPGWIQAKDLVEVKRYLSPNLLVCVPWATIEGGIEVCLGTKLRGVLNRQGWKIRLPDGSFGLLERDAATCDLAGIEMLEVGKTLLEAPYFWGGRSFHQPKWKNKPSSVDCSGLVNLLYRFQGIDLARDAHDQFLQSEQCQAKVLEEGDLVFLAPANKRSRISHVMLFAGGDLLLEANGEAKRVRLITAKEMFGKELKEISWGERAGDYLVYFGKVLTERSNSL